MPPIDPFNSDEAKALLRGDHSAVDWSERRELARSLGGAMSGVSVPPSALNLMLVLAKDPKPEVRQAVAQQLPLLSEADFIKMASRLADDDNAFVRKAVERAMDRRRRGQQDTDRKRRNAEQVQSDLSKFAAQYGRKAAERALRMCERYADVLVGSAAHNMRGTLTPLKHDLAEVLRDVTDGRVASVAGRIADSVAAVAFLERLINEMREFSHPLTDDRSTERLSVLVAQGHRAAVAFLRSAGTDASAIAEAVRFSSDVPDNLTVNVSRHQIVIAITNVIKNAYEAFFGNAAGEVRVSGTTDGDRVLLAIRDTGPGLTPEDLQELQEFSPGQTTKKNYGTGFGLPIVNRYVRAHGGELFIESTLGQGTTVTIVLPTGDEGGEA